MKQKWIRSIKSETGSGLVLSLMVLLVLSVLGASLGVITIGSYRLADTNQDSNSAYYIAEAGANMAYEEIENIVMDVYEDSDNSGSFYTQMDNPFNGNHTKIYSGEFKLQNESQPIARVELTGKLSVPEKENDNLVKEYTLTSIGEVSGKKRRVEKPIKINWIPKNISDSGGLPEVPGKASVLVKDKLNYYGANIKDNIYIDSSQPKSFRLTNSGQGLPQKIITSNPNSKTSLYNFVNINNQDIIDNFLSRTYYEEINYDWKALEKIINTIFSKARLFTTNDILTDNEIIDSSGNLKMSKDKRIELSEDVYIPKIEITNNSKLTLNTNGKDINILVDNLIHNGSNIEITDGGTVSMYVRDTMTFSSNNGLNKDGISDEFNLFYLGEDIVTFEGLGTIIGNVFIDDVKAEVTERTVIFDGLFIMGSDSDLILTNVGWSSNMHILAPWTEVSIGTGNLIGGIIAHTLNFANSGGNLSHAPLITNFSFPSVIESPNLNDSTNLISTQPAIEP